MVGLTGSGYAALHAAAFHGGLQNVGLVLIPLLLIVGSLVLDRVTLGLFTAGAILATGCMVLVEHSVLHKGQSATGDLGDFLVFATDLRDHGDGGTDDGSTDPRRVSVHAGQ